VSSAGRPSATSRESCSETSIAESNVIEETLVPVATFGSTPTGESLRQAIEARLPQNAADQRTNQLPSNSRTFVTSIPGSNGFWIVAIAPTSFAASRSAPCR
jgi:hypothetical protein